MVFLNKALIFVLFAWSLVTLPLHFASADDPKVQYRLGTGDLLQVEVFPDESFNRTVRIDGTGMVQLPLIGSAMVAGATVKEAATLLQSKLVGAYYRNPKVFITVKEYKSSRVALIGSFKTPKVVTLYGPSDLLTVLGDGGGLGPNSSGQLLLVRGGIAGGATEVVVLEARQLLEDGDLTLNIAVFPGDTLFAPKALEVYLFGQVKTTGSYPFSEGLTLLRAVTLAGGITATARKSAVEIIRKGEHGKSTRTKVNLGRIISQKDTDPLLQPNDVIIVPESFF